MVSQMSTDIVIVLEHEAGSALVLKAPIDGFVPIEVDTGSRHYHVCIPISEFHKLLSSEGGSVDE